MTTVAEVAHWMEGFAPSSMAESWDNVGLLWGDPSSTLTRVMTCLTVTGPVVAEALAGGAGLIVSHHPILFRPTQVVRADRGEGGILWSLARGGVAVYSPHTAFDNTENGINAGLAQRLGLIEVRGLRPGKPLSTYKIVVFTPPDAVDRVADAAFRAGGGHIGAYSECSYSGPGRGTFLGGEGTDPAIGAAGCRESVRERRLELPCPAGRLASVVEAIREAHPYEEPAVDLHPLHPSATGPGIGRLGRLAAPESLDGFARRVGATLGVNDIQVVGDPRRSVERVAIGCGAGDDFVGDAARAGADVLLTGEARFHRALEAESLGIGLVLAGHHATERPGVDDLAKRLGAAFPGVEVWASRVESDPLRTIRVGKPAAE